MYGSQIRVREKEEIEGSDLLNELHWRVDCLGLRKHL